MKKFVTYAAYWRNIVCVDYEEQPTNDSYDGWSFRASI